MIKKYNEFIKEDFSEEVSPIENTEFEETSFDQLPNDEFDDESNDEFDNIEEVQELEVDDIQDTEAQGEDEYFGTKLLNDLKDKLQNESKNESVDTQENDPNAFSYKGKEITFASETESFLINGKEAKDKGKSIRTVEHMLEYLDRKDGKESQSQKEDFVEDETFDPEFESKSYRLSRKDKRLK